MRPGKNLGIHKTKLTSGEIPCHSGDATGEYKRAKFVVEGRITDGTHPLFVDLDARQCAPKRSVQQFAQECVDYKQSDEDRIEKMCRVFEIDRSHSADGQLGSDVNIHAVRTAADFSVMKSRIEHLA